MDSFLTRFYAEVTDALADPSTSKRLPNTTRYRDLYRVQERIFSRLMNSAGQESDLGRTEATITVVADQDFYDLPGSFRQFLWMEYRVNGDPRYVQGRMGSLPTYGDGQGVRILGPGRGMQIYPRPDSFWAGDWTLVFRKGPIRLHNALVNTTPTPTTTSFGSSTPATGGGELVPLANYYAGSLIRIYSAAANAPQERVCLSNTVSSGQVVFTFGLPFSPLPTAPMSYEIVPELPEIVDGLYAMDVAMMSCSRRLGIQRRAMLLHDRDELWKAAKGFYNASVQDRQPERANPPQWWKDPVYDD